MSSKQKFEDKIIELQSLVSSCTSPDIVNTVSSHLTSAISILKATLDTQTHAGAVTLTVRNHPAPNSNSETQFRFRSTKKKCKASRWAKPDIEEVNMAKIKMEDTQVEVCGICLKQDDKLGGIEVDWIECANCKLWVHTACAGDTFNDDKDFHCCNCS